MREIDGFRKKLMIPDSEIPACPEFEVKSKLGKLFMNEKSFKNILLKFMKLIPFFMSITKKKKLTKMVANTYYLELMSILLNIFCPEKLMNKTMKIENLCFKRKGKRYWKKILVVSLL